MKYSPFFFLLFISFYSIGQKVDSLNTTLTEVEYNTVAQKLDSSVLNYFLAKSLAHKRALKGEIDTLVIPEFSDSVIEARLKAINSFIPLDFNNKSRAFIDMYTVKKRDLVPYILGLSDYYFPIFEAELDKREMPLELKYVPVIESALNPRAVSRAGAVGLWQFMYPTAKMTGLTITSYVDERKDPIKSTESACQYLSDLHGMFNDWQLAIAAYNCGPGNVRKAIRRSGGKTNFWEIYNYLPRETRGYVPAFIAAAYFFEFHEEHNIGIDEITLPLAIDTVMVEGYMHLNDVANALNEEPEFIKELNPQYRADIIPASKTRPYHIILPLQHALVFSELTDTLYKQYQTHKESRSSSPVSYTSSKYSVAGKSAVYYSVKSGDNLGYIADWFDTYVSALKSWNNLYGNNIRVGQRIKVYVPDDKVSFYNSINEMSFNEKKNISSHSSFSNTSSSNVVTKGDYIYYTFKNGDTLWDVSKKYPGNSINDIMSLNGISDARSLKPGQKIKLKKM